MEALSIYGGERLRGEVRISGAKNSVLPILAACAAVGGESVLHNCPDISDVEVALEILRALGCRTQREGQTLLIHAGGLSGTVIPDALAGQMRASVLFLGAVYTRLGEAELCQPGGCRLGERPIDLHLQALCALGAEFVDCEGRVRCRRSGRDGGYIHFRYPSVGATENALLAAVGCQNDSILQGCACEPEIQDLCAFLRACGAEISGDGTRTIIVRGGKSLHGAEHVVIPDRIEAVSFLCAAAGCGGEVTLHGTAPESYSAECAVLEAAGCQLKRQGNILCLRAPERLKAVPLVATAPYPRFSTDAQPPMLAALLRADGVSRFCETVFENRFGYTAELKKLGAQITVTGRYASLAGGARLKGCALQAEDLRGAAALVIAAMMAEGESRLTGLSYLRRGYSDFTRQLCALGARLQQTDT